MKTYILITALALVFSTIPNAYAGPGHDHSHSHAHEVKLDDKALLAAASHGVSAIIKQKHEIDGSPLSEAWAETPEAAKSFKKKGPGYSIVKFENKGKNKALYILISDAGQVYDANFSGEFIGLKE